MMLQPIAIPKIASLWSWIKEGLLRLLEKNGDTWSPEHVYHSLMSGESFLYVVPEKGFVVLRRHTDVDGSVALFIWIMYGKGLMPHNAQLSEELDALGRGIGAKCVRWESSRNWGKFARAKYHIYERNL